MSELPPFIIHFDRLRWHRVTPNAQCTPVLTQGCQMAVAEVVNSPALIHYIARENVPPEQTRALHHYRIYLGAGGCHEAFAQVGVCERRRQVLARFRLGGERCAAALQVHQRLKVPRFGEAQCGRHRLSARLPTRRVRMNAPPMSACA